MVAASVEVSKDFILKRVFQQIFVVYWCWDKFLFHNNIELVIVLSTLVRT